MVELDPLTALTITLSQPNLSSAEKRLAICKTLSQTVHRADRVNLWQFSEDQQAIHCVMHYEKHTQMTSHGQVLSRKDYPNYFDAIIKSQWVVVNHAREHEDTRCFNEGYFEPNDIYSLLDFVFHGEGEPLGIICCEAIGEPTIWSDADLTVMKRIASITSMFYH